MTDFKFTMAWRSLDLTVEYAHRLWGNPRDRVYIKAEQTFGSGLDDYIVKFIGPFSEPLSQDEITTFVELWLDEKLESSSKWQTADHERSQLSLF